MGITDIRAAATLSAIAVFFATLCLLTFSPCADPQSLLFYLQRFFGLCRYGFPI